jgi:hypothetical protein
MYMTVPKGAVEDTDGDDWFGIDEDWLDEYNFKTESGSCPTDKSSYTTVGAGSITGSATSASPTTNVANEAGSISCELIEASVTTGSGTMEIYRDPATGDNSREQIAAPALTPNTTFTTRRELNGSSPSQWTATMHWTTLSGGGGDGGSDCSNASFTQLTAGTVDTSSTSVSTNTTLYNSTGNSISCEKLAASVTTGSGMMQISRDGQSVTETQLTPNSAFETVTYLGSTPGSWTATMTWTSL